MPRPKAAGSECEYQMDLSADGHFLIRNQDPCKGPATLLFDWPVELLVSLLVTIPVLLG